MKKSINPMSVKELLVLLTDNWFEGTTRVEREVKKAVDKDRELIVYNQIKKGLGTLLNREEYTKVSKIPYFNNTIWVGTTIAEGEMETIVFVSNSTPKGVRYYTLNNNRGVVRCTLHFLNRVSERWLGSILDEFPMDFKIMYGMYVASFSVLINKGVSTTYALIHPYLVTFQEDEECLEFTTFLVEPIGAEQTRVYKALINYKKTIETLK